MIENNEREVDFYTYCPTCKYEKVKETEEPCNECLDCPINQETSKPIKWEEK